MDAKTTKRALAAGARTETDATLFANLVNGRGQFKKQLDEMKPTNGVPPPRGILLRYDLLLRRGRFFEPQPLPRGYRRRRAQLCFSNSVRLAQSRSGLTYCEGLVLLPLPNSWVPIEHGWCVTNDDQVIDVTLGKPGLSYFGVPFTLEEVDEADSVPLIDWIIERELEAEMKGPK